MPWGYDADLAAFLAENRPDELSARPHQEIGYWLRATPPALRTPEQFLADVARTHDWDQTAALNAYLRVLGQPGWQKIDLPAFLNRPGHEEYPLLKLALQRSGRTVPGAARPPHLADFTYHVPTAGPRGAAQTADTDQPLTTRWASPQPARVQPNQRAPRLVSLAAFVQPTPSVDSYLRQFSREPVTAALRTRFLSKMIDTVRTTGAAEFARQAGAHGRDWDYVAELLKVAGRAPELKAARTTYDQARPRTPQERVEGATQIDAHPDWGEEEFLHWAKRQGWSEPAARAFYRSRANVRRQGSLPSAARTVASDVGGNLGHDLGEGLALAFEGFTGFDAPGGPVEIAGNYDPSGIRAFTALTALPLQAALGGAAEKAAGRALLRYAGRVPRVARLLQEGGAAVDALKTTLQASRGGRLALRGAGAALEMGRPRGLLAAAAAAQADRSVRPVLEKSLAPYRAAAATWIDPRRHPTLSRFVQGFPEAVLNTPLAFAKFKADLFRDPQAAAASVYRLLFRPKESFLADPADTLFMWTLLGASGALRARAGLTGTGYAEVNGLFARADALRARGDVQGASDLYLQALRRTPRWQRASAADQAALAATVHDWLGRNAPSTPTAPSSQFPSGMSGQAGFPRTRVQQRLAARPAPPPPALMTPGDFLASRGRRPGLGGLRAQGLLAEHQGHVEQALRGEEPAFAGWPEAYPELAAKHPEVAQLYRDARDTNRRAAAAQPILDGAGQAIAENVGGTWYGGTKTPESIATKVLRERNQGKPSRVEDLNDLVRGTIVVPNWEAYAAAVEELAARGYEIRCRIGKPTKFGYQGTHGLTTVGDGLGAEIQIQTPESWALGPKSHALYEKWRVLMAREFRGATPGTRAQFARDLDWNTQAYEDVYAPMPAEMRERIAAAQRRALRASP